VAPLCTEALKFINCEMYYKDEELEILEQALYGAPLEMRKVTFLSLPSRFPIPLSHPHFRLFLTRSSNSSWTA
jgi:hypothetical protein